ncbi:LysR substrate-binding domain-containing protein [Geminicoccaceae bacterium 1502E]|nr:LysR substrate-binding domain-containing protein [Geminicoccaceae bacterium 1502E]
MTLEQLRIFVAVAEREHVTRAAAALNLTQSAVSAAIAALEGRYELRFFHRVGRRIELTEAGRILLGEAREVLARAAAAEQAMRDLAGLARGSLALAASQTITNYWLPERLFRFRELYPGIALRLELGNTATVARLVREGTVDLGLVEGEIDEPVLAQQVVQGDRLVLVVGAGHRWAGRASVGPGELAQSRWVLRETGSGTRSAFESALLAMGVAPESLELALELPSNESVRAAVRAGAGATVISALAVEEELRAGTLAIVGLPLPERPFRLLHHRERRPDRAMRALIAALATAGGG